MKLSLSDVDIAGDGAGPAAGSQKPLSERGLQVVYLAMTVVRFRGMAPGRDARHCRSFKGEGR